MKTNEAPEFKAFVIMPSGSGNEYQGGRDEADFVYSEIIKPGIQLAMNDSSREPQITREMDRNRSGLVNAAIVRDLLACSVVIADITGRNPNVFLELGIRYALRNKITIVLAQEETLIPFDVKGYRYIEYNRFRPAEARRKIAQFIREGLKEETQSDSVVFDVFRNMSVHVPGIVQSVGPEAARDQEHMPWSEYMDRLSWVCDLLREPVRNGHFTPDAVVGISNGGLIVADLVGRQLFRGTPVVSLWANRFMRASKTLCWFFDNSYNRCVMQAIRESLANRDTEPPTILLLDDHLGTGNTSSQATAYIRQELGEGTSIVFIPLVSRRLEYIAVIEEFLPYNYRSPEGQKIFNITKEQFISRLNTGASYFPYFEKEISKGA